MDENGLEKNIFLDPPRYYRPLQIIHGMDRMSHLEEERPDSDAGNSPGNSTVQPVDRYPQLDQYLQKLADLGTGGIVTNVGFSRYLVDSLQWDILRYGVSAASDLGLRVWLYDEKGYPSGTAGGYVSRANPEFLSLSLACYRVEWSSDAEIVFPLPVSSKRFVWAGAARSLEDATRESFFDLTEYVDEWQTLRWTPPGGDWQVIYLAERHTYEGTHASRNVSDFKQYINLLDQDAVRAFIRTTHEAYYRELGPELWSRIDAVFTDEPSFVTQYLPELPDRYIGKIPVIDAPVFSDRPPALPWVHDLPDKFQSKTGYDLVPRLYALFFSTSDEALKVRIDYYQLITDLYAHSFFQQIQEWCRGHGVDSSGHVLLEESIVDHPPYEGSLIKMLKTMDLPGLDMLNADPHAMLHEDSYMGASFMAIKQASSAAHLAGIARIHSESSDWVQRNSGFHASLEARIGQINLQYALGVNVITSYYSWKEIGEAGWKHFNDVAGRLGTLLTGGVHCCDVAVLYPIRTAWAHFLPPLEPMQDWENRPFRTQRLKDIDRTYTRTVRTLLVNQVDCDIVDEESIEGGVVRQGRLEISTESYRLLVLPDVDVLSPQCLEKVREFVSQGGMLILTADSPDFRRGNPTSSTQGQALLDTILTGAVPLPVSLFTVPLDGLTAVIRDNLPPDFQLASPNQDIVYTHRVLESRDLYFVANSSPNPAHLSVKLRVPGPYDLYQPATGAITPWDSSPDLHLDGYGSVFIVSQKTAQ